MDRILIIKWFLSLPSNKYIGHYYTLLVRKLDQQFGMPFQYVYNLVGTRDKRKIKLNNIRVPWNPQLGFYILNKAHFKDAIAFVAVVAEPIASSNALNVHSVVLLTTGDWHTLSTQQKTIIKAWTWRIKKLMLRIKFSKVTGNMGRSAKYVIDIATNN